MRGFLNDGTTDYSLHHRPQSLAFGHCDLAYRNLGRLTQIKVSYDNNKGLRVETNGKLCFETNKVKLPKDYRFGVSAASADNPDSFELFAFKVASDEPFDRSNQPEKNNPNYRQQQQQQQQQQSPATNNQKILFEFQDKEYTYFETQSEQFQDIHNRLQALVSCSCLFERHLD